MPVRRSRGSRKRSSRGEGAGGGAPSASKALTHEYTMGEIDKLEKIHQTRTPQAQHTDNSIKAGIAPTPHHWIKYPNRWDVPGVDYPEGKARRVMNQRSEESQRADRAKQAPIASTPEAWAKQPSKYDYPGIDTKTKTNPLSTPTKAKKHLAEVVEKYRKKLGIKGYQKHPGPTVQNHRL